MEDVGGVMHCFSSDVAVARRCLDLGLFISLAGPVTYKNARALPDVARFVPEDRLVVETDCPYLPPSRTEAGAMSRRTWPSPPPASPSCALRMTMPSRRRRRPMPPASSASPSPSSSIRSRGSGSRPQVRPRAWSPTAPRSRFTTSAESFAPAPLPTGSRRARCGCATGRRGSINCHSGAAGDRRRDRGRLRVLRRPGHLRRDGRGQPR